MANRQKLSIIIHTKKNGEINVKCYCDKFYPLSVMIKNSINKTE